MEVFLSLPVGIYFTAEFLTSIFSPKFYIAHCGRTSKTAPNEAYPLIFTPLCSLHTNYIRIVLCNQENVNEAEEPAASTPFPWIAHSRGSQPPYQAALLIDLCGRKPKPSLQRQNQLACPVNKMSRSDPLGQVQVADDRAPNILTVNSCDTPC